MAIVQEDGYDRWNDAHFYGDASGYFAQVGSAPLVVPDSSRSLQGLLEEAGLASDAGLVNCDGHDTIRRAGKARVINIGGRGWGYFGMPRPRDSGVINFNLVHQPYFIPSPIEYAKALRNLQEDEGNDSLLNEYGFKVLTPGELLLRSYAGAEIGLNPLGSVDISSSSGDVLSLDSLKRTLSYTSYDTRSSLDFDLDGNFLRLGRVRRSGELEDLLEDDSHGLTEFNLLIKPKQTRAEGAEAFVQLQEGDIVDEDGTIDPTLVHRYRYLDSFGSTLFAEKLSVLGDLTIDSNTYTHNAVQEIDLNAPLIVHNGGVENIVLGKSFMDNLMGVVLTKIAAHVHTGVTTGPGTSGVAVTAAEFTTLKTNQVDSGINLSDKSFVSK